MGARTGMLKSENAPGFASSHVPEPGFSDLRRGRLLTSREQPRATQRGTSGPVLACPAASLQGAGRSLQCVAVTAKDHSPRVTARASLGSAASRNWSSWKHPASRSGAGCFGHLAPQPRSFPDICLPLSEHMQFATGILCSIEPSHSRGAAWLTSSRALRP
jgi:hypothetical protein